MNYSLLIGLLGALVIVFFFIRIKQNKASLNTNAKYGRSAPSARNGQAASGGQQSEDWLNTVNQTVDETDDQDWEWESGSIDPGAASVSAQEVDPLTEYQVYKQFGYEDKAAASLAGYLDKIDRAPEKLLHELANLSLSTGNIDLLASVLEKHGEVLNADDLANYVREGLSVDPHNLPLRVVAEHKLSWGMNEVAEQIGEKTGLGADDSEVISSTSRRASSSEENTRSAQRNIKRSAIVVAKGSYELRDLSAEEMTAVIGFVKPERSTKLLQNQIGYEAAVQQYNRAIQKSEKPAALIIDALKLDYQHNEVEQFAGHLWKLYYSLGSYGRQVKERMLGWGYNLGQHELFDELEKGPNEQQIREIGLAKGYLQPSARQLKSKYRELVLQSDSVISDSNSPSDVALKEVESLLMYGQLEQAISTLEQAVLQYPEESQLYITLFDLYERSEDWVRLEQFLKLLRDRVNSLPEEVVLAMSQLVQRVQQISK
ncbi:hypothetical protein [Jeotgalibaca porci]|uniref:hypothetical protein n=1 Tax=Jeotgalibaca porci TaxID=1868793 RepID=UPI0035A18BA8